MIQPVARAHSLGPDFPPNSCLCQEGLSAKVVCGKLPCSIFSPWPLRGVHGKERQGLLMVEARALLLNGVRVLLFMFPLSTSASDHAPYGRSNTRQSNETLKPKTPIGLSISIPILLGLESNGYWRLEKWYGESEGYRGSHGGVMKVPRPCLLVAFEF
jgi:hypothetical protein